MSNLPRCGHQSTQSRREGGFWLRLDGKQVTCAGGWLTAGGPEKVIGGSVKKGGEEIWVRMCRRVIPLQVPCTRTIFYFYPIVLSGASDRFSEQQRKTPPFRGDFRKL